MTLDDDLRALAASAPIVLRSLGPPATRSKDAILHALVRPLFAALGYDLSDSQTVAGVDLAIAVQAELRMLIEVRPSTADGPSPELDAALSSTGARLAITTDGVLFHVLVTPNLPPLELDLLALDDPTRARLARLSRDAFDPEALALDAAVAGLLDDPPPELVALVHARLHPNEPLADQPRFTRAVARALERARHLPVSVEPDPITPDADPTSGELIVTTEEELAGYALVRELVADILPLARIGYRDRERFFGIIIDGDERQTLCRLHFNRVRKYIGIFSEQRREKKHRVETVDAIRALREPLREAARRWAESTGEPS